MPFPFALPTTASFAFSDSFSSDTHPSLPLTASTYRNIARSTLKSHKRLSPSSQASNLANVLSSVSNYLPYLLALDAGISHQTVSGEEISTVLTSTPSFSWRPTLSDPSIPGREVPRVKLQSLEYEVYFILTTLAYTNALLSRVSLQPLYSTAAASPTPEQRTAAIQTATKYLLTAASIHSYLSTRSEQISRPPPCTDITTPIFRALTALALGEATLLAVLKDDPYPAAVAQDRNSNDNEWMIRAPSIPKVRAHLFARLCLAAAEHAAKAVALLSTGGSSKGKGKVDEGLVKYCEDLKRTGRGKACRFFGIDAELGGQTGEAIAWCQAGMIELGLRAPAAVTEQKKGLGFTRLKKEWTEKREDKKVEKGRAWGMDAGKAEEGRVLEMLEKKWNKENDTVKSSFSKC